VGSNLVAVHFEWNPVVSWLFEVNTSNFTFDKSGLRITDPSLEFATSGGYLVLPKYVAVG
jgi:hypothetical protein